MLRELMRLIKNLFSLVAFQGKWRKNNKHNFTYANNVFPINAVKIGNYTYADLNVYSYRNPKERLEIGNFCSIASDVIFVLSGEHPYDCVSTYPFVEKKYHDAVAAVCRGSIIICDDVWIGVRCTILSGVTIGQGAIIGANSIVNKDVPPYSIYAGHSIIKKRFDEEVITKLMEIDYSRMFEENFKKFHKYCTTSVTTNNIDEILLCFPKKEEKEQENEQYKKRKRNG